MKKHRKYREKKKRQVDLALLLLTLGAVMAALLLVVVSSFSLVRYFSEKQEDPQTQGSEADTANDGAEELPSESQSMPEEPVVRPQGGGALENYRAVRLDLGALETAQQLRAAADRARQEGYTAVVIDAKAADGHLQYASAVPLAAELGLADDQKLTARQLIRILHENDLFVTVRLLAFSDNAAAAADPAMALKTTAGDSYAQDGALWLDPASKAACGYALSLLRELDHAGADEISLSSFGYPLLAAEQLAQSEAQRYTAVSEFAESACLALEEAVLSFEITPQELIAPQSGRTGIDLAQLRQSAELFVLNCVGRVLTDNLRAAAAEYPVRLCTSDALADADGFTGVAVWQTS